jgi:hypothetical protein
MYCLEYQPCVGFINHGKRHHKRGDRVLHGRDFTFPSKFTQNRNSSMERNQLLKVEKNLPTVLNFPSEYTPNTDVASHEATLDATARNYRRLLNLKRERPLPIILQSQRLSSPSEHTQNGNSAGHGVTLQLDSQLLKREQSSPIILQSQRLSSPSEHTQNRNSASHELTFNSTARNIGQLRSRFLKSQQRNVVRREAALDSTAHNDGRLRSIDKPGTIKELHDFSLQINILEKEDLYRYFKLIKTF